MSLFISLCFTSYVPFSRYLLTFTDLVSLSPHPRTPVSRRCVHSSISRKLSVSRDRPQVSPSPNSQTWTNHLRIDSGPPYLPHLGLPVREGQCPFLALCISHFFLPHMHLVDTARPVLSPNQPTNQSVPDLVQRLLTSQDNAAPSR